MIDLIVQLGIVEAEFIRELTVLVGVFALFLISFVSIGVVFCASKSIRNIVSFAGHCPGQFAVCAYITAVLVIYAALKPAAETCDYRLIGQTDMIPGTLDYCRYVGNDIPAHTNIACCSGVVTNDITITASGQFYFETAAFSGINLRANGFWVRDAETDDWIQAIVDVYSDEYVGWSYVDGWSGALAHLPDYGDPKDYRYWFIGPRENLPEKIVEGGVEIVIDKYVRTSSGVYIEFHPKDPENVGKPFTLQIRELLDSTLLDWRTLASTTNGVFNVPGNFVQYYNRMRIHCDTGDAE